MEQIYTLDSDSSLLDQLAEWIRNRSIDQKFMYQWKWADLYYEDISDNTVYTSSELTNEDFLKFYKKNLSNDSFLVSLWCWASHTEKFLIESKNNENFTYIWVDSSKEMLESSISNMKDLDINKTFLNADFSSKSFREELFQLSRHTQDNRTFVFFSNTFWNIKHTNIIDILWNLLSSWEKIWMDVRIRKGTTIKDDIELSNLVNKNLFRKETNEFLYDICNRLSIPKENIKISTKIHTEKFISALRFEIYYEFLQKTEIILKWEKYFILPGEQLKALQIYSFDPSGLEIFFEEHGFKLIDKQTKGYRWQFLFEKK